MFRCVRDTFLQQSGSVFGCERARAIESERARVSECERECVCVRERERERAVVCLEK